MALASILKFQSKHYNTYDIISILFYCICYICRSQPHKHVAWTVYTIPYICVYVTIGVFMQWFKYDNCCFRLQVLYPLLQSKLCFHLLRNTVLMLVLRRILCLQNHCINLVSLYTLLPFVMTKIVCLESLIFILNVRICF